MTSQSPKGWRRVKLGSVIDLISGQHIQADECNADGRGVPYLTGPADFVNGTIRSSKFTEAPQVCCKAGDILITVKGSGTGSTAIADADYCISRQLMAVRPKAADHAFIRFKLESQAETYSNISAGLIPGITRSDVLDTRLEVPPLAEQQKIGQILALWTEAVEKTEQLIAAKETSQRGWMQKLVMDRLFHEHRLSEFVRRVYRKNTAGNDHPLTISGRDGLISQSHYFDKRIAAEITEHYTLLKRGEFAYNRSYSARYPYGAIKRLDAYDEGIVSTLYLGFGLNPEAALLSDYLIQFCEVGGFNHQIHKVAEEGARNHGLLNVAAHDFFAMKLPVPPIEEQSRVVAILGDAGHELTLLRKFLDQLRQQKRGLMQKLLTGQWRVPVESKEVAA